MMAVVGTGRLTCANSLAEADTDRPRMVVLASSVRKVREVRFFDGTKRIATAKAGTADIFGAAWNPTKLGRHILRAVVVDSAGKKASAERSVRVCK